MMLPIKGRYRACLPRLWGWPRVYCYDGSLSVGNAEIAQWLLKLAGHAHPQTVEEAQKTATTWLWAYNNDQPNSATSGITPAMKINQPQMVA